MIGEKVRNAIEGSGRSPPETIYWDLHRGPEANDVKFRAVGIQAESSTGISRI
jgi:hypothetical protein